MYSTKEIVQQIKKVVKRRYKLFVFTPIFFVLLSGGAIYMIEPKYESSTTILVQKEETLNPLLLYQMAVNVASEDRLKSFNEIIYSRSTMEMLIDSLGLDKNIHTEAEKQSLVEKVRKNITTSSRASDSFEITFFNTDPVRARDGVQLLAQHFISSRLRLENRRNNETVEFFQSKLNELENIVDKQRESIVNSTAKQMKEQPVDPEALQTKLQAIDTQIDDLDWKISQEEQKAKIIKDFLNQKAENFSMQPIYKLPIDQLPFGTDLSELLKEYDGLKQKFTDSYPQLRSLRTQIIDIANRIAPALQSELTKMNRQRQDLSTQRAKVIQDMEKSFVETQRNNSKQSDFSIYQELYNDMKVKLEQARMTRDIGDKASEQFIVLDPAYIAKRPSSPNERLIIGVGLVLGIVMGALLMGVAEVLDTTVREEEDLDFEKPIIAYLTDGTV